MNLKEKLLNIQVELKAEKGQYNSFGKYSYRSCEDILEALKPHLAKEKAIVKLEDKVIQVGDRYYIEATASIYDVESDEVIHNTASAREEENKKGMDASQVSGATSSYARKYALNGLFGIDDNKDSDSTNKHGKEDSTPSKKTTPKKEEPKLTPRQLQEVEIKDLCRDLVAKHGAEVKDKCINILKEFEPNKGLTKDMTDEQVVSALEKIKNLKSEVEK